MLNTQVPLSEYLGQFHEVEKRLDKRGKRRLDMDRYREDVKQMTEKGKDPQKLGIAKEKVSNLYIFYFLFYFLFVLHKCAWGVLCMCVLWMDKRSKRHVNIEQYSQKQKQKLSGVCSVC